MSLRATRRPFSGRPTITARSASRRESEKPRGVGTSWTREPGVAVGEAGEPRGEEADAEAVGGADADDAGGGGLGALQAGLDGEHLGLDALEGLEKRCAGVGQLAAVGAADEELGAERGLERGHPAGERRLVDAERAGGAEHLAGARDREEHAGVVPVEGGG